MRYYLIVGEASGDLHASRLMRELQKEDSAAEFRFFGGDEMSAVGGVRVRHYKDLAYMGFIPVLLHLRTIFKNMDFCKQDILQWRPDRIILVDYPGFNLKIAKWAHDLREKTADFFPEIIYYISPKIWAWKEYRIKNIKRDIDRLFSILPFEVPFFEQKHGYKIDYVGNPTAQEVREFTATYTETNEEFCKRHGLNPTKRLIAILPGSRKQEIKDNLRLMLGALSQVSEAKDFVFVIAGAPGLEPSFYDSYASDCRIIFGETYKLLSHSYAALVVSGTATLETALFRVPQVVIYKTPLSWLFGHLKRWILKVKWVSLVNLVAEKEVVPEQVADTCKERLIAEAFTPLLSDTKERKTMLDGYEDVWRKLGPDNAPEKAAELTVKSK